VVGGLALFLVAAGAVLVSRAFRPTRSAIEGTWYAEVAYSWGLRRSEQFEFSVDGDRVVGTASFGGAQFPRRVLEGKLTGDRLFFITKLRVTSGRGEREIVYQYTGRIVRSRIQFTLDNESAPPTRFVAARTTQEAKTAAPKLATGGTDPRLTYLSSGPYSTDAIKAKVAEQQEAIKSCYVATEFDPIEHASVFYFVKIGPDGKATEVGAPGTDPRSAKLDQCMELVFRSVTWEPTPDGKSTEIRLAFTALPSWRSPE
jgi:hypothetical protein